MFLLRLSPRQTLSTILLLGTLLRDNYVTGFPAEGLRTIAADMESAQQPIARVEKRAPVAQPGTQRSAPFPAQTDALVARKEVAPPAITEAEGLEPAQPAITAAPELEERWVDFCNGCEGSTGVTSFRYGPSSKGSSLLSCLTFTVFGRLGMLQNLSRKIVTSILMLARRKWRFGVRWSFLGTLLMVALVVILGE